MGPSTLERAGPEAEREPAASARRLPRRVARPARFALVGAVAAAAQLGVLAWLLARGWGAFAANLTAFMASAQINFTLHSLITWGDHPARGARDVAARWLRFHGAIAGTALMNQALFLALHRWLPPVGAAGMATLLVAAVNYMIGSRFVFRVKEPA